MMKSRINVLILFNLIVINCGICFSQTMKDKNGPILSEKLSKKDVWGNVLENKMPIKNTIEDNKANNFANPKPITEKEETVKFKSIHQEESEKYNQYKLSTDAQWDSLRIAQSKGPIILPRNNVSNSQSCVLNKRVYGWHPYWSNGLQNNYNWAGLTDLCYFAYEVNSSNGNPVNTHSWSTAQVVSDAQSNGVNVTLCATLFSGHTTFFASSTAKQTLITNLINLVQSRNAKGVNIDFEGMGASNATAFTSFMISLCNQMHSAIPGSEVSVALYSVDWSNVFNVQALNPYVDLFIIMGYDYYYSGSATAGPGDPLYNFQTSYNYTLTKSITFYLNKGVSNSKLLLGLPYYGREWSTNSGITPSSTTGSSNSVFYNEFRNNLNAYYNNRQWDINSFSAWYPSQRAGQWWQCFINDTYSMRKRFDLVNQRGIGGIGIWALGYDDGYNDFWNLIQEKFTDCAIVPCADTIYDMGGPNRDYYNNEDYSFTIAPTNAISLTLNFSSFATELNYDTLWIYDGPNTSSLLIGIYHGTNNPGIISSTGSALTIRFKSDLANQGSGWQAMWDCIKDNIPPNSEITVPGNWETQNFNAGFNDTDNIGGSGIEKSFYQVLEFNGLEWRANNSNGFFNDNFDNAIHSDWLVGSGTWLINGGYLEQSDEANSNTNIYAPLKQNLSNRYLYNWKGLMEGLGTNRRAGFHFFCDSAAQTNRGNSYFVWFRADQGQLEIYKVVNNNFGSAVYSAPLIINTSVWYDYKVLYDRISGKMDVYVNDALVASWTDPAPYADGNYISFRNGNCNYKLNNLKVYRSRLPSVTITVGPGATNDVRYQNPNPETPSCTINSITKDGAGNLSLVASQNINIDWSVPTDFTVNDGTAGDTDTTNSLSQLSSNWTISADTNSGIEKYWYAIGSSAGASDIKTWTDNGLNTSVSDTGLTLLPFLYYYYSVKSLDSAGLQSSVFSSDGQLVYITNAIEEQSANFNLIIYPNPVTNIIFIKYFLIKNSKVEISLNDVLGKEIILCNEYQSIGYNEILISANDLNISAGVYFLKFKSKEGQKLVKIILN